MVNYNKFSHLVNLNEAKVNDKGKRIVDKKGSKTVGQTSITTSKIVTKINTMKEASIGDLLVDTESGDEYIFDGTYYISPSGDKMKVDDLWESLVKDGIFRLYKGANKPLPMKDTAKSPTDVSPKKVAPDKPIVEKVPKKAGLSLTNSKIVKEKYGDGFSIEINGVEYRYSSLEFTANEIATKVDLLSKKSPGVALKWLKTHTVCYYGGKDKRKMTADRKASKEAEAKSKSMPKAEKDPKKTSNPEFDAQLKRIEKFADTMVKDLDKDPNWTFKYIDEPGEMSQFGMVLPGLLLATSLVDSDKSELNKNLAVSKFNKSKTLKRYRDWFSTDIDGISCKAIIYVDADAARSKGVKGLKEYEDLSYFDFEEGLIIPFYESYYLVSHVYEDVVEVRNKNDVFYLERTMTDDDIEILTEGIDDYEDLYDEWVEIEDCDE